ncbi:MAG: DMT family transporter [Coriobacteriia bacterium]|nr:DMT family transporter [Coriobacteriia bacterium]
MLRASRSAEAGGHVDEHSWRREPSTWVAIIVALLFWASAFAGIRAGLESYGPGQVALLRFGTASAVFLVWATVIRMRLPDARDIPRIALAGLLGITVYHVALNYGEVTVTAGAASLIISASPIITALLSTVFIGERLSVWGWIGIVVSFAGVALISLGEGGGLTFEPGAALVFVSAVATSVYFIVSKRPLRRYSALEFTSYAIWAGTVPMFVFAPGLITQMAEATPAATWAVVYLGVFPGAVAYALWSYALSRMPATSLSTFLYFQPVNAIAIAWLWLGEVPALLALVGGVISLAGVAVVNTRGSARD